jgi:hypothetical protein
MGYPPIQINPLILLISSRESDKSQSKGEGNIVQNLKFAGVEDRGGVVSKNMEGQNRKEKCAMSGNLNDHADVGKSPYGCVIRDELVQNSKLALVEDISGVVTENMEGQKRMKKEVIRGNLKNHVDVGKSPDVFVLRDEASESSFMPGGDYLRSNVTNNKGAGEGQEVLANLAHELTRMDVGVEFDEVGHVGEKLKSMGGVMSSKYGVEGAVSNGSNMK